MNEPDPLNVNFVAIGHLRLGQFVTSSTADSKLLLEVKSVNKAEFSWLTNHRLQFHNELDTNKSFLRIHGNVLEGKTEVSIQPGAVSFREIDMQFKVEELIKESSLLKNSIFLVGQSLDLLNFSKSTLKTKGNMSYIV